MTNNHGFRQQIDLSEQKACRFFEKCSASKRHKCYLGLPIYIKLIFIRLNLLFIGIIRNSCILLELIYIHTYIYSLLAIPYSLLVISYIYYSIIYIYISLTASAYFQERLPMWLSDGEKFIWLCLLPRPHLIPGPHPVPGAHRKLRQR